MPSEITIFLEAGKLNEVNIEIQHVRLDIQGKGTAIFKIQGPINQTLTAEEEKEYKRRFLQTIQNLEIENIEFE